MGLGRYFSGQKGKHRTIIILEQGAKHPADLGGECVSSSRPTTVPATTRTAVMVGNAFETGRNFLYLCNGGPRA